MSFGELTVIEIVEIVGILAVLIKIFIPTIIPTRSENADIRNKRADTAKTYKTMLDDEVCKRRDLEARLESIESRLTETERELAIYIEGVDKLIEQFEELGIEPVWKPVSKKAGK
jgi:hypothetical protein